MRSIIKVILFDFGGVLAEAGFRNGLLRLAREQHLNENSMPEEGLRAVSDSGFVIGQGTATDFWGLLGERTGLTQRILDGFVVHPWMMDSVEDLKRRGYIIRYPE